MVLEGVETSTALASKKRKRKRKRKGKERAGQDRRGKERIEKEMKAEKRKDVPNKGRQHWPASQPLSSRVGSTGHCKPLPFLLAATIATGLPLLRSGTLRTARIPLG